MRKSPRIHRPSFFLGVVLGLILVVIKLLIYLPVDVANLFYGIALLITLVITAGEIAAINFFVSESRFFNFIVGVLFPLDCYAVLILFGVPLVD